MSIAGGFDPTQYTIRPGDMPSMALRAQEPYMMQQLAQTIAGTAPGIRERLKERRVAGRRERELERRAGEREEGIAREREQQGRTASMRLFQAGASLGQNRASYVQQLLKEGQGAITLDQAEAAAQKMYQPYFDALRGLYEQFGMEYPLGPGEGPGDADEDEDEVPPGGERREGFLSRVPGGGWGLTGGIAALTPWGRRTIGRLGRAVTPGPVRRVAGRMLGRRAAPTAGEVAGAVRGPPRVAAPGVAPSVRGRVAPVEVQLERGAAARAELGVAQQRSAALGEAYAENTRRTAAAGRPETARATRSAEEKLLRGQPPRTAGERAAAWAASEEGQAAAQRLTRREVRDVLKNASQKDWAKLSRSQQNAQIRELMKDPAMARQLQRNARDIGLGSVEKAVKAGKAGRIFTGLVKNLAIFPAFWLSDRFANKFFPETNAAMREQGILPDWMTNQNAAGRKGIEIGTEIALLGLPMAAATQYFGPLLGAVRTRIAQERAMTPEQRAYRQQRQLRTAVGQTFDPTEYVPPGEVARAVAPQGERPYVEMLMEAMRGPQR